MHSPPRSHPDETTLLLFSTGRIGPAFSASVASHAAGCPACAGWLRAGAALGGALLMEQSPTPLSPGALDRALHNLRGPPSQTPALSALTKRRALPVAPGVRHRRLFATAEESLHLFRVRPGASLPSHDHDGEELTSVIAGAFQDATGLYVAGDAVPMRPGVAHEPVAIGDTDCVCLLAVSGHLRFAGLLPRLMQHVLGL